MIWDILLLATVETGLRLLDEVGFGDSTGELKATLLKMEKSKRQQALQQALDQAVASARDEAVESLLAERVFQEEVVRALLDPLAEFNAHVMEQVWGDAFLSHVSGLRRFFAALQHALYEDPVWGPVFEQYQELRVQREVRAVLQAQQLPVSDGAIVSAVSRSTDQYTAVLKGDGAIAQGEGAKAVGAKGILVEGDVGQIVQITLKQFIKLEQPAETSQDLERRYLQLVADHANLLNWVKVTTDATDPSDSETLQLDEIYIELYATETLHASSEEEYRQSLIRRHGLERLTVQEIVNSKSKLLIMGEPGSGKSTFLRYLAYLMAQARLAEDPAPWIERLLPWEHGPLLVVRLDMRFIPAPSEAFSAGPAKLILNFIRAELLDWGLEEYWPVLQAAIQGKKEQILFLLDGLDEVSPDVRESVVESINELSTLHPQHRYIVTCRPYAYLGQSWRLKGFHEVSLANFDEHQIDQFIDNWYYRLFERVNMNQARAQRKSQQLKAAVRQQGLIGLAERPILLAVMAQLHTYTGKLPEERTQLFADAVDLLLLRWESRQKVGGGILKHLNIPGLKMSDLEAGLFEVAFRAQLANPVLEDTAEIAEGQLRAWLSRYINNDWNKAGEFISYIRERAGLLIRYKPDAYIFPHRSFQEFLAACYWLSMDDFPSKATELTISDFDRWHEVFLLSTGYAARTKRLGQAIAAVNSLLPRSIHEVSTVQERDWKNAILAGKALIEIGVVGLRRELAGQVLFERVQTWLVHAIEEDRNLNVHLRVEAGSVLGRLGDPRRDALTVEAMQFYRIPPGEFSVTEGKNDRTLSLNEFWIGKYPITNAQFQEFVDANGYQQPRYWEEAIRAGAWKDGQIMDLWGEVRSAAPNLNEPFNLPNHPIVGITWFEARAFARWLDEYLHELANRKVEGDPNHSYWKDLAEERLSVSLPEEVQWEIAACGNNPCSYPWLGDMDTNKANVYETGINATSAVGCFPGGASPYGVLEMSGNVWEWMLTEETSLRIIHGGSYYDSFTSSRCDYRDVENPLRYDWTIGFRVALTPSPPTANPE